MARSMARAQQRTQGFVLNRCTAPGTGLHCGGDAGGGAPTRFLFLCTSKPPRGFVHENGVYLAEPHPDRYSFMFKADQAAYDVWTLIPPATRQHTAVFVMTANAIQTFVPFLTETPCLVSMPSRGENSGLTMTASGAPTLHALLVEMITQYKIHNTQLQQMTDNLSLAYKAADWAEQAAPDLLVPTPMHTAHLAALQQVRAIAAANTKDSLHVEYVQPLSASEAAVHALTSIEVRKTDREKHASRSPPLLHSIVPADIVQDGKGIRETGAKSGAAAGHSQLTRKQFIAGLTKSTHVEGDGGASAPPRASMMLPSGPAAGAAGSLDIRAQRDYALRQHLEREKTAQQRSGGGAAGSGAWQ